MLDWSEAPFAKWFADGKLNVAYNCVDRHVEAGHGRSGRHPLGGRTVGDSRSLTYSDLQTEVCKAANALTDLGLVAGDRVAIYMPLIPEAVIAMLACARLGIMHSVVFAGFTAKALRARIADAQAKLLITSDGQFRRGKPAPLKDAADEAMRSVRRTAPSSTFWWCGAPELTCPGTTTATCGGTTSSTRRRPNTPRSRSTPSSRCSCCTRRAPPASPRASCTPAAAI